MSARKRTLISIIVLIIAVLGIWSIILDFSRFYSLNYNYDIYPSAVLKRINVILAAAIAWTVGKDRLSMLDSRRMKAAFLFIIIGETAFALSRTIVGVCLFAVSQTLLIIRNSTGLRDKLIHAGYKQKKGLFVLSLTILLILVAMAILFGPLIMIYGSTFFIFLYGILLSASLWAGLTSKILGLLPEKNSNMAAVGMICFYCCDVLVGLDAVMETGLPWLLANSFIWVFYISALVLLALSCYRYN